uniref:C2HC/C3H-type domain-containing protein n=1 Tax=Trypanosoma congolense (strain IL3000) TaxID=1068625 RepID=G0UQU5_TRYCI|nr:conserved hypothetical protein [Trypanosoma congolense IL3000]
MPQEPSSATNFVQDYAAKRAAQIERAKKIREERLERQKVNRDVQHHASGIVRRQAEEEGCMSEGPAQQQLSQVPAPFQRESVDGPSQSVPAGLGGSSGAPSLQPPARGRRIANVVEEDFKRATRAGIITPDQARQLWAMLSDQLVQVENPHTGSLSSTSVNALLLPTVAEGALPEFGGSISMDSLRASIAQFKEQQRRRQQQRATAEPIQPVRGVSGAHHGGWGQNTKAEHNKNSSYNSVNEAYDVATRLFSPSTTPDNALLANRTAMARDQRMGNKENGGSPSCGQQQQQQHGIGEEWALRDYPAQATGARRETSQKPAWNYDVSVPYDEENEDGRSGGRCTAAAVQRGRGAPASRVEQLRSTAVRGQPNNMLQFDDVPVGGNNNKSRGHSISEAGGHLPLKKRGSKSDGTLPVGKKYSVSREAPENSNNNGNNNFLSGQLQSGGLPRTPPSLDDVVVGGSGGDNKLSPASFAPPAPTNEPLLPCSLCGRTFRSSILSRHEAACAKVQKKRRVFDMKEQRLDGIEGIQDVKPSSHATHARGEARHLSIAQSGAGPKLPKWKIQHEQFQAAMRAMRQMAPGNVERGGNSLAAGADSKGMQQPMPLPAEYDDRVPCPHCGRKFAQTTAERHIPKCATTIAKPKGLRPARR